MQIFSKSKLRVVLFTCGLVFSISAFGSNWVPFDQKVEKAVTPAEIESLLNRYTFLFGREQDYVLRKIMSGGKADVITELSMTTFSIKFQGPSKCAPNDPRLIVTDQYAYQARYSSGHISTLPVGPHLQMPGDPESDPCGWMSP